MLSLLVFGPLKRVGSNCPFYMYILRMELIGKAV